MVKFLAQIRNPVLPPSIGGGDSPSPEAGSQTIGLLVGNIIGAFFIFAFIVAFLYLLVGAFKWITSSGDKGKLEEARNQITHALVGILLFGAAWAIITLVGQFLGLDFQNLPIPTIE